MKQAVAEPEAIGQIMIDSETSLHANLPPQNINMDRNFMPLQQQAFTQQCERNTINTQNLNAQAEAALSDRGFEW